MNAEGALVSDSSHQSRGAPLPPYSCLSHLRSDVPIPHTYIHSTAYPVLLCRQEGGGGGQNMGKVPGWSPHSSRKACKRRVNFPGGWWHPGRCSPLHPGTSGGRVGILSLCLQTSSLHHRASLGENFQEIPSAAIATAATSILFFFFLKPPFFLLPSLPLIKTHFYFQLCHIKTFLLQRREGELTIGVAMRGRSFL